MAQKRKTIYVTEEQEKTIMKNAFMGSSFTKRLVHLALVGAGVEKMLDKVATDDIFNENFDTSVYDRVKELIRKGYLYEEEKEPQVSFEKALGYFNAVFKKKYPNRLLPVNDVH
jgi:hypothetical protein